MLPDFALESVLRVRTHLEKVEEAALAELTRQKQQVAATLARVQRELSQWTEGRMQEAGRSTPGASQHSAYARLLTLRQAREQLLAQQHALEAQWQEQMQRYLAAHRAKETLTQLKKTHLQGMRDALQRREQRQADDLFLSRRGR